MTVVRQVLDCLLVFVSPGCSERLHSKTVVGVDKIVQPLSPEKRYFKFKLWDTEAGRRLYQKGIKGT